MQFFSFFILYIFFTRVGDSPERILYTFVSLTGQDWQKWKRGSIKKLLKPELPREGSEQENKPSLQGEISYIVNQLRDPYVFQDTNGDHYFLYTGGAEQTIGIVKLKYQPKNE